MLPQHKTHNAEYSIFIRFLPSFAAGLASIEHAHITNCFLCNAGKILLL